MARERLLYSPLRCTIRKTALRRSYLVCHGTCDRAQRTRLMLRCELLLQGSRHPALEHETFYSHRASTVHANHQSSFINQPLHRGMSISEGRIP
jgi:hypothetical protein